MATFGTYAEQWVTRYALLRRLRDTSTHNLRSALKVLLPAFGSLPLSAIKHRAIEDWIVTKLGPGG